MKFDYICNQLVTILHCSICYINSTGEIEKYFGDNVKEHNPVFTDKNFCKQILSRETRKYPVILHEHNCIFYGIISLGNGKLVAGPVSIERPGRELNEFMMDVHHIKRDTDFRIAYCEMKIFGSGVLLLYHCLTGKEMTLNELWKNNAIEDSDIVFVQRSVSQVIFKHQENGIPHNPYDQERRELDSIRRGDTEMLRRSLGETYRGEVGRLSRNQLRQAKNIAICVITLASRAAIDGGLLPEKAFSMVDGYVLKIEEMNNTVRIDAMMREAEYEYAEMVAKINNNRQKNELIEKTKNYIFQHLHDDIVIDDVSHEIGVNTSYLSTLFHKVEGVTIQNYIRREKIYLAENLLRYSKYTIQEIANYLAFSSQSYFGRAFKAETGATPLEYRKKFGRNEKNKNE